MNDTVTLAHGAGGKQTNELIDRVFKAHFANPDFTGDDAAVLPVDAGKIAFTTDGFIVSPYRFPGGNIGKLSICGTVNDLACMGAKPLYMTCAFVIEEGFPLRDLEEIAASMKKTAEEAGVRIVAGDTKVAGSRECVHRAPWRNRAMRSSCPETSDDTVARFCWRAMNSALKRM